MSRSTAVAEAELRNGFILKGINPYMGAEFTT